MNFKDIYDVLKTTHGLSRAEIASCLNMSEVDVKNMLSKKREVTKKHQQLLQSILDFKESSKPFDLMFDYIRLRFETHDWQWVVDNIIGISIMKTLEVLESGFYGYNQSVRYGDITVMWNHTEEVTQKGVLVVISGRGCRQLEYQFEMQSRNWYSFFETIINNDGQMNRIDLAIDDEFGLLDVNFFNDKREAGELEATAKSSRFYKSGEIPKRSPDYEKIEGATLYIGSQSSKKYICWYEKDYEQYVKTGVERQYHTVKNRLEIRVNDKDECKNLITEWLGNFDLEKTALGVIENGIRFVDSNKAARAPTNHRWQLFLSRSSGALKLSVQPKKTDIEDTWIWLDKQVSTSMKMAAIDDTERLLFLIDYAELKAEHRNKLLAIGKNEADYVPFIDIYGDDDWA